MKFYVQYLDVNPFTGKLYEPCGDRSVVILDGRNKLDTMIEDAKSMNGHRRPKFPAFKIMRGERFTDSTCIYSSETS